MLKIRLKRQARKRLPFYRIVLMENLSKRDGRPIEELGFYDPLTKKVKYSSSWNAILSYLTVLAAPWLAR